MSLRDTRAANELPSGEAVAGLASGRAILQARQAANNVMRFPDHTSYIRYKAAQAQIQLRQEFRAARAAARLEATAPVDTATTPGAPTSLCVFPGDSQITISFTAPTNNGGAAITNYEYSLDDGDLWTTTGSATSPVTIPGLSPDGTVYSIQLRAVNRKGGGAASSAVSAAALSNFTPVDVAGLNLWLDSHDTGKVTVASGSAVTEWISRAPAEDIFAKSLVGTITYDQPSRINNRPAINFQTAPVQLQKTLNLAPSNQITVFAIVKQTDASNANNEIFSTNPYQHFDLFIQGGVNNYLEVNVTAEEHESSTRIFNESTLMSVTVSNTGGSNFTGVINMFVNGLQKIANSSRNPMIRSIPPGPTNVDLTLNTSLPWRVSGQGFIGDIGEIITYPSVLSATDRQRVEGYLAWKWGLQESLPIGHACKSSPRTVPGAPTDVSVSLDGTTAIVSFNAPFITGGFPIEDYTVTSSPDGLTATGGASPLIIEGLRYNVTYTFTVTARNSIGSSPPSAVTLNATPSETTPRIVYISGINTFYVPSGVTSVDYLLVGGGGGGGGTWDTGGGGGGGGGMVKSSSLSVTGGSTVTITVGGGGDGGLASSNGIDFPSSGNSRTAVDGSDGEASILSYASTTITALGGGRGYRRANNASGGAQNSGGIGSTDSIPSTGGDGGAGFASGANYPGSGGAGGGYSANGANGSSGSSALLTNGGAGRSGLFYSGTFGAGGKGGFGQNSQPGTNNNNPGVTHRPGDAGASNTGNGGEGGSAGVASWASGGNGGSGIVVIQYSV